MTQEKGNTLQVVLFPVKGGRTSLYHKLGHVLVLAYDMTDTLKAIWEYDREGTIALTSDYAGESADECWAEAFRFMLQNMDNPTAMEKAKMLMPVSYLCFQRFIEYDKAEAAAA